MFASKVSRSLSWKESLRKRKSTFFHCFFLFEVVRCFGGGAVVAWGVRIYCIFIIFARFLNGQLLNKRAQKGERETSLRLATGDHRQQHQLQPENNGQQVFCPPFWNKKKDARKHLSFSGSGTRSLRVPPPKIRPKFALFACRGGRSLRSDLMGGRVSFKSSSIIFIFDLISLFLSSSWKIRM